MQFSDFKNLVDEVNRDIGRDFTNTFQYKRKDLIHALRTAGSTLFGQIKDYWAINKGGGIELQYHIGVNLDKLDLWYGLGFNTQYVPFANEMSPLDYMRPFMNSFLILESEINTILPDYSFIHEPKSLLINPENDRYVLFGKSVKILKTANEFEIPDDIYNGILSDLKNQFKAYIKIFEKRNQPSKMNTTNQNYKSLLKYKNQIILQGPPGTGKTRLAKEIAQDLTALELKNIVEVKHLIRYLIPSTVIQTPTKYNTFSIVRVDKDKVIIYPKDAKNEYSITFKDIIKCAKDYNEDDQVTKFNQGGVGSYLVALSNYIVDELAKEQYKIIQFHPAYSYEDFVRGIVVDGEGEKLKYETKNKILGEFAQKALKNYQDSNKESTTLSFEKWFDEKLSDFKEHVEEIAEKEENGFALTDNVSIYPSDDLDAFRYKGANWATPTMHRLRFTDIKLLYDYNVDSLKAVKSVPGISGSAIQHKTYYFNLLLKFKEFLKAQPKFESKDEKTQQLNYVLIIDEINRANLPAVLGELIYALEYRGEKVQGMYSINGNYDLILPPNLFIIGTMNTADRSVGHIDYAIRRRFAFVDILPSLDVIKLLEAKSLFIKVASLFIKNDLTSYKEYDTLISSDYLAEEFRPEDIWLGHSYFLAKDIPEMRIKLKYEIIPILKEYVKDGVLKESAKEIIETLHL